MSDPSQQSGSIESSIPELAILEHKITAADFGSKLDPDSVVFTVFAKAPPLMRAEIRKRIEEGDGDFPSLLQPLSPVAYQNYLQIGQFQQIGLRPPLVSYIMSAPTILPGNAARVFGVCRLRQESLGFKRKCDIVGTLDDGIPIDCDAFIDVPWFLAGMRDLGALDIALRFLLEKAACLTKAARMMAPAGAAITTRTVSMITTNPVLTRVLMDIHGFEYYNPRSISRSPFGRGAPTPNYIMTKTVPARKE